MLLENMTGSITQVLLQSITRGQILDSSKLKEFADDNFKFDENGRKLSKWVKKMVGNGEIACYQQLLLFPVFSLVSQGRQKASLCGNGLIKISFSALLEFGIER